MSRAEVSRREFLRVTGTAGGGMAVALVLPGALEASSAAGAASPGTARDGASATTGGCFSPNAFLRVEPDGSVVLIAPRPEMGQGVRTSLPMIVAEELEVAWEDVRIEQAHQGEAFRRYADQFVGQYVGGSASVWRSWEPLRRAGAVARTLLVAAAAETWGVSPATCRARSGRVLHPASGRHLGYGEVAADAARLPPPDPATVALKDPTDFRIVGTSRKNVDAPEIVRGETEFGLDIRVPGMLFAGVERAPTFGARVAEIDDAAARRVEGVVDVVEIDPAAWRAFPEGSPKPPAGVAVLAESTWAAMEGRRALRVRWDEGPGRNASTERFWTASERAVDAAPAHVLREDGDPDGALAASGEVVTADYRVPFLAHVPMEPMNCTAHVEGGRCRVWAPTQNPLDAKRVAARVSGLEEDAVTVRFARMGGAFGRRFYSDFVAEAVWVSRAAGRPVQVVWSREDDVRHGFYRPAGLHRLRAALGPDGLPEAWTHHLANASRYVSLDREVEEPGDGELSSRDFPAGFVPSFRLAYSPVESAIPRGQWRAIRYSANVFVVESFLDELAHAAGRDPLEYRLAVHRSGESPLYDAAGLRRVLEVAAERAGWARPLPEGRGRGIAGSYANAAYAAHVAEVSVDGDGRPRVHRVVSAVDPGRAVNPAGVRAQVEGSVAMGLSAALGEEVTVAAGRVEQGNFDDYRILRIGDMPEVEVHIVDSGARPDGMGEGALPPVAPAVTNAIFDATGQRIRRLPLERGPSSSGSRDAGARLSRS